MYDMLQSALSATDRQREKIWRESNMKKMALVLAAVLASGMVLTACGGSGNAAKETTGSNTSTTATTTGGLDLAVQIGPDPETVDPALNTAIDASNVILHAFETLLTFDENNDIVPGQAESFDVSLSLIHI